MALTVIEHQKNSLPVNQYPCLGRYDNGMIVLFTSKCEGTVLVSTPGYEKDVTGEIYTNFDDDWEIYEGTVVIKNKHS